MPDFAYRTEATIDAAPKVLFDIVSNLSLHVELAGSGELKTVTQKPAGAVEMGTRFLAEESVKLADGSGMDVTSDSVVVTCDTPTTFRGSPTQSCRTGSAGCSGGSTSPRRVTEHASCTRSRSTSATCRTRCSRDSVTTSSKSALPLSEPAWTGPSRTSGGWLRGRHPPLGRSCRGPETRAGGRRDRRLGCQFRLRRDGANLAGRGT